MKQKRRATFLFALVLLLSLAVGAVALAQTSADFNLEWNVIGGGGGESSSAGYRVQGTIGQAIAGPPLSTSADFRVGSGYWYGAMGPAVSTIYLPLILLNYGVE